MDNAARKPFPRWRIAGALVLSTAILAAAAVVFAPTVDPEGRRTELCREILPALHVTGAAIEVIATDVQTGEHAVQLTYRLDAKGREGRRRWVRCTFETNSPSDHFPVLDQVETETGMLGDGRLFVLKRWWLEEPDFLRYIGQRRGRLHDHSV